MGKFRDWLTMKKTKQTEAAKTPTTGKQLNDDKAWGNPAPTVQLIPKSPLTPKEDGVVILSNNVKSASFQPSKSAAIRNPDSAPPIPTQNPQSQSSPQIVGAFGINRAPSPSPPPSTEVRVAIPAPSTTQATSSSFPPPASYQAPDSVPVPCSQRPCVSSPPSTSFQGLSVTLTDFKGISLEVGTAESLRVERARPSPSPPPLPQPPLEFLEHPSPVLQSQSTSKTQPSSPLSRSELQESDSKVVRSTIKLNKYSNDCFNLKSRSHSTLRLPTNFPILNLLPELILSVADHLDYSTTVLLSLSCKKLHDLIPIPQQTPDWPQERTMLQITLPFEHSLATAARHIYARTAGCGTRSSIWSFGQIHSPKIGSAATSISSTEGSASVPATPSKILYFR